MFYFRLRHLIKIPWFFFDRNCQPLKLRVETNLQAALSDIVSMLIEHAKTDSNGTILALWNITRSSSMQTEHNSVVYSCNVAVCFMAMAMYPLWSSLINYLYIIWQVNCRCLPFPIFVQCITCCCHSYISALLLQKRTSSKAINLLYWII